MSSIYGRIARLKIGVPGQNGKEIVSFVKEPTGIVSTGLRISFDIEKNSESNPNKSTIDIYNLAPDTIALLKKKGCTVELRAGFGGILDKEVSGVIYRGDVFKSFTKKNGPDYITTVESSDGLEALQNQTIDVTFAEGARTSSVIDRIIESFGLSKSEVQVPNDFQYQSGLTLSGSSRDAMNQVTSKAGLEWSVQDGAIQVLAKNASNSESVVVLSSDSGLIGSPQRVTFGTAEEGQTDGLEYVSLLNPHIKVGRTVQIISKFINNGRGAFYVNRKVKHKGDTYSGEWSTSCEAVPL